MGTFVPSNRNVSDSFSKRLRTDHCALRAKGHARRREHVVKSERQIPAQNARWDLRTLSERQGVDKGVESVWLKIRLLCLYSLAIMD